MNRPWVTPAQVKDYTSSDKVKERGDSKLAFDIARAEKYVIFHTHNRFTAPEYNFSIPSDVAMAIILLAEAYAKQACLQKEGTLKSETFDDYSYTIDDSKLAENLGLGTLLEEYVLPEDSGKVTMKLRKL